MNIDFNKIAEFCVTKNQKKKISILQKKFSFNNSKSREARELPALKNNPNITKIVIIDPKTKISTVIFQR